MPHLIVEYSASISRIRSTFCASSRKFIRRLFAPAPFEVGAVRTRAVKSDYYAIADAHKDNAFVAVMVRVAPGRPLEVRQRIGQEIFDAACEYLETVYETTPIGISLEVQEINKDVAFRKNNLHAMVKQRAV